MLISNLFKPKTQTKYSLFGEYPGELDPENLSNGLATINEWHKSGKQSNVENNLTYRLTHVYGDLLERIGRYGGIEEANQYFSEMFGYETTSKFILEQEPDDRIENLKLLKKELRELAEALIYTIRENHGEVLEGYIFLHKLSRMRSDKICKLRDELDYRIIDSNNPLKSLKYRLRKSQYDSVAKYLQDLLHEDLRDSGTITREAEDLFFDELDKLPLIARALLSFDEYSNKNKSTPQQSNGVLGRQSLSFRRRKRRGI
jgi:hypothetical protein